MSVEITTDYQQALERLQRALASEAGGRVFRRDLAANLDKAVRPAVAAVRARVMSIPSRGGRRVGGSIRRAIAQAVESVIRLEPRVTGVLVRIGRRTMPREFGNAPKRFNQETFRRQVYGRGETVQRGQPYFEETLQAGRPRYQAGCVAAMDDMAARVARKVR